MCVLSVVFGFSFVYSFLLTSVLIHRFLKRMWVSFDLSVPTWNFTNSNAMFEWTCALQLVFLCGHDAKLFHMCSVNFRWIGGWIGGFLKSRIFPVDHPNFHRFFHYKPSSYEGTPHDDGNLEKSLSSLALCAAAYGEGLRALGRVVFLHGLWASYIRTICWVNIRENCYL